MWRVGRHLGRTIYLQVGSKPGLEDTFVGIMDTKELAELVVETLNERDERILSKLKEGRENG